MLFNKYPYTDMHDLNLDWIIAKMKELDQQMDDFTALNAIKWTGNWDPNIAYEAWSIVRDTDGSAYISLKAVPAGVLLTNAEYWSLAFDYNELYHEFNSRLDSMQQSLDSIEQSTETMIDDAREEFSNMSAELSAEVTEKVTLLETEQTVLSERMDTFASLPAGSTSGNAELLDIRVGADGVTYSSAGNAVRSQVDYLQSEVETVSKVVNLIDEERLTDNKYYDPNTGQVKNGDGSSCITELIPVSAGQYYFYTNFSGSQVFDFIVFNNDKSFSRAVSTYELRYGSPVVTIAASEGYVGITLYNSQLNGKTAFVSARYKGYFKGLQNTHNVIPPHLAPVNFSRSVVVDRNGNGDYTTINDALAAITYDTANDPVTIYVKPGVYEEVVRIYGNRHISIIGENMKDCILRDDTGLYENCPLQISGDFIVENMTIISTHDDNASMDNETPPGNKAYALHADYAGEGTGYIRNCKLISDQSSAIGSGLHQDQTLYIENCELISNTPATWTSTGNYGALFVHSATDSNVSGQHLIVKDCMMTSSSLFACAFSNSPDGTSNMTIDLINNNLYCLNGATDATVKEWYNPVYSARSHGNNINKLNG